MSHTERDQALALAGIYQAAYLTQKIGQSGVMDTSAFEPSIKSLIMTDAESTEAIYGGTSGVSTGLNILYKQLQGGDSRDLELTRYVIALLALERKLNRDPKMLQTIASGLETTKARLEHFHLLHSNILSQLADIYANTISTLSPRIMVQGETMHLQNPDNISRIRALLLAGIRSAMLWRQVGGKKRKVIFGRKKLMAAVKTLLDESATGSNRLH
ncbi:MAG: high frequency lysogenization protein HflD [Candidatus Polarisedimenticolaceae bacterium]|nr:high frequency lysogenization protein HflD [Candidatus Polarisedimenticolaceae bacterium]